MGAKSQGAKMAMEKFREMIRLHELGRNQTEIARSCNVARSTVQDYLRRASAKELNYAQLQHLSDSEAQALLGKGQRKNNGSKKAIAYDYVHRELAKKGVTLALVRCQGV